MQVSQESNPPWSVVVVGAGAAGLMAAIFAAMGGARVLVLETRRQPGAKIRVSGGSRCNVLPSAANLDDFFTSGSPNALRNVLFSWPLAAVHHFFEQDVGVPLKVEATGKVFPRSDRSKDVVDGLLGLAARVGVTWRGLSKVTGLTRDGANWRLRLQDMPQAADVLTQKVILATGGLSLPKTGSDGGGWRMARGLGHTLMPTYPALVPLCTADAGLRSLAGLATPARLEARRGGSVVAAYAGDFLFTHGGFSGPVVLNISRCVTAPDAPASAAPAMRVHCGFGDASHDWERILSAGTAQTVVGALRERLPRRLADMLMGRAAVAGDKRLAELSRGDRLKVLQAVRYFELPIAGNEGYGTAEVTAGGIPLAEVHPKTLESRAAPGLHVAGEMLDVVGKLGGYNFLWAWVSGRRAGLAAAQSASSGG